jgi:prephenate dehydrogenase
MSAAFERVAVLGTGLVGGSFALAARAAGAYVVAWDQPSVLAQAMALGAIDQAAGDMASAVRGCDLVYMALPIGATLDALPAVAASAEPGALVTDAGSTKVRICQAAAKLFTRGARFLGGHPMAGRETGGIATASADLFRGARYALVAEERDTDSRVTRFAALLHQMGGEPVWLDAETHDWAAAIVSHLPQLTALALARVARDETDESGLPLALAGAGLRDALRLAGSPYEMWRDVCHTNPENIRRALDRLSVAIDHLRTNLHTRALAEEFAAANQVYKTLRGMK